VSLSPADRNRIAAARLRASGLQPFLAEALYALQPTAQPGLGTFAVDAKWRLYIDPIVLHRWTVSEVAGVLLHEVGHVIRDHQARAVSSGVDANDEWQRRAWNIAGDIEINDDLVSDGADLPGDPMLPASINAPSGKAAEFYFALLRARSKLPPVLDCGPGAHGGNPHELGAQQHDDSTEIGAGSIDSMDRSGQTLGLTPAEVTLLRKRVAEAVIAYKRSHPGHGAGGWERWAEAVLRPCIDWRSELQASIRGSIANLHGHSDYTFAKPSRRRLYGIVLPALVRPLPIVAIVIDTSASVDADLLGQAWTEVIGCVRSLGVRRDCLSVFAVDTEVHRVKPTVARKVSLAGGGGTDMRMGIERALLSRPKPGLLVVLTDGETPWPEKNPGCRVVVGVLGQRGFAEVPTWAKRIDIPLPD
jgi:predicted metal-dependent peptidase